VQKAGHDYQRSRGNWCSSLSIPLPAVQENTRIYPQNYPLWGIAFARVFDYNYSQGSAHGTCFVQDRHQQNLSCGRPGEYDPWHGVSSAEPGPISAFGVGAYIIPTGLGSSPIIGALMKPARSFDPDLVLWNFSNYWVYIVEPIAGALVAVGIVFILRGRGSGQSGIEAEQGRLEEKFGGKLNPVRWERYNQLKLARDGLFPSLPRIPTSLEQLLKTIVA
jgi:Major intrinsic protein